MDKELILASTSLYRKALLNKLSISFTTAKPLCDEEQLKEIFTGSAHELCMHLAKKKALSVKTSSNSALVIGSDQALIFKDKALGKGKTFEGAFKQLTAFSGKSALLVTATYLHDQSGDDVFFECNSLLNFKNLSPEEITNYLHLDEPYDCAGSFKFELNGGSLFKSVETSDETAIEGLPLKLLKTALKKKGLL